MNMFVANAQVKLESVLYSTNTINEMESQSGFEYIEIERIFCFEAETKVSFVVMELNRLLP